MSTDVALLDVNVPMYAAGGAHPLKEACAWVMTEIAEGRLDVAIDTETVQEILYRYGALGRWEIATTMASNLLDLVPVVYPVLEADARKAVELFREYAPQGVTARDVLHAAVMQNDGMTTIISTDEHFDRIKGVLRLDPQALFDNSIRYSGTLGDDVDRCDHD
jgi:predicted nucleic acid-binding protein